MAITQLPKTPTDAAATPALRVVMVAGASGLVGREIVRQLCADPSIAQVHSLVRKLGPELPGVKQHQVVFANMASSALPACDTVLIALGTTIKTAGSKQAFAAVDLDAVVATAAAAKKAGARAVGVVSSMGASASSGVFYSRTKGQMEDAVTALGFERTVFARPSFLAGDRAALKQAERPGEALALHAMRWFKAVIPANYQAVSASDVAAALIEGTRSALGQKHGVQTLLSGQLQRKTK